MVDFAYNNKNLQGLVIGRMLGGCPVLWFRGTLSNNVGSLRRGMIFIG